MSAWSDSLCFIISKPAWCFYWVKKRSNRCLIFNAVDLLLIATFRNKIIMLNVTVWIPLELVWCIRYVLNVCVCICYYGTRKVKILLIIKHYTVIKDINQWISILMRTTVDREFEQAVIVCASTDGWTRTWSCTSLVLLDTTFSTARLFNFC